MSSLIVSCNTSRISTNGRLVQERLLRSLRNTLLFDFIALLDEVFAEDAEGVGWSIIMML